MSQGRLSPNHSDEVCQISVPSAAVGAIIGSGGANIKQIIRESGALVTVSYLKFSVTLYRNSHTNIVGAQD